MSKIRISFAPLESLIFVGKHNSSLLTKIISHFLTGLISLAAFLTIGAAGAVLAQEEPAAIAPEETVTISDLGVSEPTVLPTSPFYFFKELGRSLQGFITFNPVAKAELELKFANEKAAETKKITETQPANTQAIQKALENYQKSQTRLRARFEALKETSQNPKMDELLNKLTDRVVKHEKLFDEISFKFQGKEDIVKAVRDTMAGSENVIGEASKKDDAAKFASRLEKVLLEEKGGELKHARSVEMIDRLSGKTPEAVKESLGRLREEFSEKLETDINDLLEKNSGKNLEENLGKVASIVQRAKEQIDRAEKAIQSAPASTLLTQAKVHLENAKSAFEQKKYGEAFGQARSAEVIARNALKTAGEEKPKTQNNFEQLLKELEEKISAYRNILKERSYTEEQNKDAYELLSNAVLHFGYAKDNFAKGDLEATKLHMGHVRDFLSKLSRVIEAKKPTQTKPAR